MRKIKVATIIGTRPEIIKLSQVIKHLDKNVNHLLIHTGQNYDYEMNEIFFEDLDIRKPDIFLNTAENHSIQTISNIISKSYEVLNDNKPDAVLLYGDTNSCLSVLSAKKLKIPIFHMEAGNRCFDQRVPEENNRKIVDHLSDINLPLSEEAKQYLIREGIRPETIFKIGSPMQEVIEANKSKIEDSNILKELNLKSDHFFLISAHREENVDTIENLRKLIELLKYLESKYNLPIIISTHPRTRKKLEQYNLLTTNDSIQFLKPFGFSDYIKLQANSFCVLSDSGTITEESALLGFPAITIRETHERPEGTEDGVLIMQKFDSNTIDNAIQVVRNYTKNEKLNLVSDYQTNRVSEKVVKIILSYTSYINNTVWRKYQ